MRRFRQGQGLDVAVTGMEGRRLRTRALRGLATLVVASVTAVWGATAAAADDVRVYEVPSRDASMNVTATCTGTTCSVVPVNTDAFFPGVWTEPLTVTDGRGELVLPHSCTTGDYGPDGLHGRLTLTVTMTASELVATRTDAGGVFRPTSTHTCSVKPSTITQRLTLVAPPTPSATPTPAPSPVVRVLISFVQLVTSGRSERN